MKNSLLKRLLCLFAIAAVAPGYSSYAQDVKGLTRSIIINNGDTTVNGKKFSELDKEQRTKLREEFKEMEKNFRGGNILIRKSGSGREDVVITRDGKEPKVLVWDDEIGQKAKSFNFNGNMGDLRVIRRDGDSLLLNKDFQVFSFDGDSSMNFTLYTDSLLKGLNFKLNGLDSNMRKRVVTMNREMLTGRPGRIAGGNNAPMIYHRENFEPFAGRNNSSSFSYSHIDNDGIPSRMNIRISEAGKDQLKKITGAETINKSLDVTDLTLFPNFSTGKMTLSFNIASKGTAKIGVLNSEMKSIFTDEASNFSGNYVKQLTLPKNGVYYVSVSQNGNWFVKRLVKE
ncbi:MAG: T9SS type A sorting domain-containing protein [Bacteroidota bacterium]